MEEVTDGNLLLNITGSTFNSSQMPDSLSLSSPLSTETIAYATVGLFGFFINLGIFFILLSQRSSNAHVTEFLMMNQVVIP